MLLPYMMKWIKDHGGNINGNTKVTDLEPLRRKYDVVINCAGVWAKHLTGDNKINPLRGQVMRIRAPWLKRVVLDDNDDGNYVVPKYSN